MRAAKNLGRFTFSRRASRTVGCTTQPDGCRSKAVIKLLADDYGVPCTQPEAVWRPVLAAREAAFREIAHHPS